MEEKQPQMNWAWLILVDRRRCGGCATGVGCKVEGLSYVSALSS
jgi:hypothetical protein